MTHTRKALSHLSDLSLITDELTDLKKLIITATEHMSLTWWVFSHAGSHGVEVYMPTPSLWLCVCYSSMLCTHQLQ